MFFFKKGGRPLSFFCAMCDVRCAICDMRCAMCDMRYAICDMRCAMCDVRYEICDVRCEMCDVRYAMCDVRCAIWDVRHSVKSALIRLIRVICVQKSFARPIFGKSSTFPIRSLRPRLLRTEYPPDSERRDRYGCTTSAPPTQTEPT